MPAAEHRSVVVRRPPGGRRHHDVKAADRFKSFEAEGDKHRHDAAGFSDSLSRR